MQARLVVVAPERRGGLVAVGHEDAVGVAGHLDEPLAHRALVFALQFEDDYEASIPAPHVELERKARGAVIGIQWRPVFDRNSRLERARYACHDDVGQRAFLQKLSNLWSKKPLPARTVRSFQSAGIKASASCKNGTTPRAEPALPLRNQPWSTSGASASTACSGL